MLGTVKWFDQTKGFGFILNPEGKDVFVHFTSILCEGYRRLRDGERVEFEQEDGPKGLLAKNVKPLDARPPKAKAPVAAAAPASGA